MKQSGFGEGNKNPRWWVAVMSTVGATLFLACLVVGWISWQQTGGGTLLHKQSRGVRVSGEAEKGRWPLQGINEGTILCQWHEFLPGSRDPMTRRPLVLFEAPSGRMYAVNGAAESAAEKGFVTAAPINDITVERRLWLEVGKVMDQWLDAGLALCEGDYAEAQRLAANANRMTLEPMSPGVEFDLSSADDEVRHRRIFFELVQCQDEAWRVTSNDLDSRRANVRSV